jgi:hypothetical protein
MKKNKMYTVDMLTTFILALIQKVNMRPLGAYLDYILFCAVIFVLILDLLNFCHLVVDHMSVLTHSSGDSILQMSSSNPGSGLPGNQGFPGNSVNPNNMGGSPGGFPGGPNTSHNKNIKIIHDDGNWSNTIRSIFVYGTGGLRF